MKKIFLFLLLSTFQPTLWAHDHLEIYLDSANGNRLAVFGNFNQTATYFPPGESPSTALYAFPGGAYTSELAFSSFDDISSPPGNVFIRVNLLSVSGPVGGLVSFWDADATSPTWTRPSGWVATASDHPSIGVSQDTTGYGHIHGRAFSTNKPGVYEATFQAVADPGNYPASLPFVVRFTAIDPPKLSIRIENNSAKLSFISRADMTYDVQSSTTLQANSWSTIETKDGTGSATEFAEPLNSRPRVFYRIVEY